MLTVSLIGAGAIGRIHAGNIAAHPGARLGFVHDVRPEAAAAVAACCGARVARSLEEAVGEADAAIIASSTASHGAVAQACIAAKTPFLCEKPLGDSATAERIVAAVRESGLTAAMGFNRRLHGPYAAVREAVRDGTIGALEALLFTSRSESPPTVDFVRRSGGLLGEKGSHFYDLACWITGDVPVELNAMGACLVNPEFASIGEVDTAMLTLRMSRGILVQFDFSWRAAYGQDERIEAHGSLGMVQTEQSPVAPYLRSSATGAVHEGRLPGWHARLEPTYRIELDRFLRAVQTGAPHGLATLADGLAAQRIAEAGMRSIREGRRIAFDG